MDGSIAIERDTPTFAAYDGIKYHYIHNSHGDIVGIIDAAGNLVVEYKYDAWGKPLSVTGTLKTSLGILNPFRYRGYVYDEESDLYYLENRYYLSCINRFINGDWVFLNIYPRTSKPLYQNLFAYCENNPVTKFDPYGLWSWKTVLKAVATVAVVVATIAISASIGGPVGTVSAVKNGVTMVCAVVDGAVSAIVAESGTGEEGDMVDVAINGALCGALGGCAGIVADTCLGRYIKGPEDYVGMTSTVGRAVSSTVYDLSYALIAHGEITSNDVTLCVIDIVMDSMYSTVYYSYSGSIKNTGIQAAVNGVVDGIVDVYQTDQLYKTKLKNYGGFRNMQQEIKYMYA